MMRVQLKELLAVGLLLGSSIYALAEEITLTTYYPSPRGVYQELRVGQLLGTAPMDAFDW